jgi:hypothetical protein
MPSAKRLRLNVGGKILETTLETLQFAREGAAVL